MSSSRIYKLKFDELASTHTYAIENYDQFLNLLSTQCDAILISCDRQVQGIGSYDLSEVPKRKEWIDGENGAGNIKCSVLIKVPITIALSPSTVNTLAVVEICKILESYQLQSIGFKWPNDIMVNNKKAGGMLSQLPPLKGGKIAAFNELNVLEEIDLSELGRFSKLDMDENHAAPYEENNNDGAVTLDDQNQSEKYNQWSIPMVLSFGVNLNPVNIENSGYVLEGCDKQKPSVMCSWIGASLPESFIHSFLELGKEYKNQAQFITGCQSWLAGHTFGRDRKIDVIDCRGKALESSVIYKGIDVGHGRIIYQKGDGVWTRRARQINFVNCASAFLSQ